MRDFYFTWSWCTQSLAAVGLLFFVAACAKGPQNEDVNQKSSQQHAQGTNPFGTLGESPVGKAGKDRGAKNDLGTNGQRRYVEQDGGTNGGGGFADTGGFGKGGHGNGGGGPEQSKRQKIIEKIRKIDESISTGLGSYLQPIVLGCEYVIVPTKKFSFTSKELTPLYGQTIDLIKSKASLIKQKQSQKENFVEEVVEIIGNLKKLINQLKLDVPGKKLKNPDSIKNKLWKDFVKDMRAFSDSIKSVEGDILILNELEKARSMINDGKFKEIVTTFEVLRGYMKPLEKQIANEIIDICKS
ncbi:MAG: hypothetical protein AAF320_04990 [Myxococcota bacterium]